MRKNEALSAREQVTKTERRRATQKTVRKLLLCFERRDGLGAVSGGCVRDMRRAFSKWISKPAE
jgi:hypothetical protein